jgi:hypothetical protein
MSGSGRAPGTGRRRFLQGVAGAAASLGAAVRTPAAGDGSLRVGSVAADEGRGPVSVRVEGGRVRVETATLAATLDEGSLTSLRSRRTGEEMLASRARPGAAVDLVFRGGERVAVGTSRFGRTVARSLSDRRAEVVVEGWDGDAVVAVGADPETGDLVLEPSAFSSRPGLRACRYWIEGVRSGLRLVAPFFQGVSLELEDPLLRDSHWAWPMFWEAGLAILQGGSSGFWVHARDVRFRYKALHVGAPSEPRALGLDSEAYGPIDDNLAAGGLAWRLNVFEGDWTVPAGLYRDWLWRAYGLEARQRERRPWVPDVALAVSWCPGDVAVLEALARRVPPGRVLLHYPDWRTDAYDENYPTYVASEKGRAFVARARALGFRVMPHFNSVDMDPSNPVCARVRDFQYRDIETKRVQGWAWYEDRVLGVPESNGTRMRHRDKKVMVKIHPGLSLWRSILGDAILEAARPLDLETVFVDVTLVTQNLHNGLVEGTTSTEGMRKLIDHVAGLGKGLVVGGEGLNEVTAQGLSFAQAHLFRSWQENGAGLERTGGCALNDFLFGRLCRTIGYSALSGKTEAEQLRMRIHEEHGAIPTITIDGADEILRPNPAVERVLARAAAAGVRS